VGPLGQDFRFHFPCQTQDKRGIAEKLLGIAGNEGLVGVSRRFGKRCHCWASLQLFWMPQSICSLDARAQESQKIDPKVLKNNEL
jgi:hypothetical protein